MAIPLHRKRWSSLTINHMELAFRDDSGMELSIESAQQIMTTRGYLTQTDFRYV